ncbi:hypothetical protein [Frigoribacterium sp. UYMn621]|uniref:hypothetical protein n=1 Tax=Frigoribacterium sp. UYMn621 TaxID=3156343 RepID=UPI00339B932B
MPVVYVLSEGRLKLNAEAVRRLGDTTWVQLLWDDDTKRIGIKPATETSPLAVRVAPGESQATITSKAFVVAHKLPFKVRMRIAWNGDMWVASTEDPANPLGETSGR